jgi:hypothetical protein
MRWTMSDKPCEALRIRQIRSLCRGLPRRSAYLWSGMVKPRLCEVESVFESSILWSTSKRQYGVEVEGSWMFSKVPAKSILITCEHLWLEGYKSSASTEGATGEKMNSQIHKTIHLELGCSGDLNLTGTVHPVNVGTSCSGLWTGLAAVEVEHEGREIRSSLSQIRSGTWRRNLASCSLNGSRENGK